MRSLQINYCWIIRGEHTDEERTGGRREPGVEQIERRGGGEEMSDQSFVADAVAEGLEPVPTKANSAHPLDQHRTGEDETNRQLPAVMRGAGLFALTPILRLYGRWRSSHPSKTMKEPN